MKVDCTSSLHCAKQLQNIPKKDSDRDPGRYLWHPYNQTDCASVSYQIVEELIQNGHQKIGIICGSRYSTTAKERLNGYLRVMEDYEIPLRKEYLIEGNYDYASGYDESGL